MKVTCPRLLKPSLDSKSFSRTAQRHSLFRSKASFRSQNRHLIQPVELRKTLPIDLHGGVRSTTTAVWEMLCASRVGDIDRVKDLGSSEPGLITCQYNYTPPIHFAVREGHLDLVRELV